MAAVIVPRNDEIFKIRGAGVAAGRDLQAGIAPCADDWERQAERGDIQNADVALAVDLAFRHGQLRIQHIIRDKCLLFPLSSGRLGRTFLPGQVGCQAFKDKLGSAVAVLASVTGEDRVQLAAGVTKDLTGRVKAGELAGFVAGLLGAARAWIEGKL